MHDCPFHIETCQGCDDSTEHIDYGLDEESGSSSLSTFDDGLAPHPRSSTSIGLRSFHSPDANRVQIKEEFLRLYLPAETCDLETDLMYTKFLGRESLEGMGEAMNAAVETIALIQLGTAHADQRLVFEAQTQYKAAVACVNEKLMRPDAMYDDGVLGAIYLLGFCEMYRPLSEAPWRTHHGGLQDILLARGPTGTYSRFAQLLSGRGSPSVAAIGNIAQRTDGFMAALTEHIITVDGVLEDADLAMHGPQKDPPEIFNVLMQLFVLERNTQTWLLRWYLSFDQQPYWQDSIQGFQHFTQHLKNAPKVFLKGLRFPSFSHASAQITYWVGLFQSKETMFDLTRVCPHPSVLPKSAETLVNEANEIVDKLCESVAYLTQPCHGFCGVIRAAGPLRYATKWYTRHMDIEKMAWCEKITRSIEAATPIASFYHNRILGHSVSYQEASDDDEDRDAAE